MGIKVALEKIGVHAVFENVTDSSVCNTEVKIVANGEDIWVYDNIRKLQKMSKSNDLVPDELRDDAVEAVREIFQENVENEREVENGNKVEEKAESTEFSSDLFNCSDF